MQIVTGREGDARLCKRRGCLSTNSAIGQSQSFARTCGEARTLVAPQQNHVLCAESRSVCSTQRTPYREVEHREPYKCVIIQMRNCLYPEDSGVDCMVILVHVLDELQLDSPALGATS
jgi:hypothetical protein